MKLKQLIKELRCIYIIASKFATQQAGMMEFIPGMYQREKKEGSSRIIDRVIIRQVSQTAEIYSIQKVLCKCYTQDEKIISQPKDEEWMAFYDFSSRRLLEVGGKKSLTFFPENSSFIMDNIYYSKVSLSKGTEF